jgi:serine/threonine protein phosphatase PrpC
MDAAETMQVCAESNIGLKREENEDSNLIVDHGMNDFDFRYYGRIYAVADGLRGHAGGKIASEKAYQGLIELLQRQ